MKEPIILEKEQSKEAYVEIAKAVVMEVGKTVRDYGELSQLKRQFLAGLLGFALGVVVTTMRVLLS
jgi:hypothetical protein